MDNLKQKVEELEKMTDEGEIVKQLQEIGKMLLTDYIIKVGDITVEPLWVEAYYYNGNNKAEDDKNNSEEWKTSFKDPFIHGVKEQKDNGGNFYFHPKNGNYSGVDICLSYGAEYYLSYLLKYTFVYKDDNEQGKLLKQSQLKGSIKNTYDNLSETEKSNILLPKKRKTDVIAFTSRIGLNSEKEKNPIKKLAKEHYKSLELAIVRDFHKNYESEVSLPQKEKLIKKYLNDEKSSLTKEQKADFCNKYLNYCPKEFK